VTSSTLPHAQLRRAPTSEDRKTVQALRVELKSVEERHLQTLESWLIEAERWEKELTLTGLAKATPFFETELSVREAEQRVKDSAARYYQATSDHEDLTQAVVAAKTKVMVILQTRRKEYVPEMPEDTHDKACSTLKEITDRCAEAQLRADEAEFQYKETLAALQRMQKTRNAKFLPYFIAKWEHEARVLQQIDTMAASQARIAEILTATGMSIDEPGASLSASEHRAQDRAVRSMTLPLGIPA